MEDLFVVKLDRISEEEIQRLCNPEDKKAKEENNNEDTTVEVDVSEDSEQMTFRHARDAQPVETTTG